MKEETKAKKKSVSKKAPAKKTATKATSVKKTTTTKKVESKKTSVKKSTPKKKSNVVVQTPEKRVIESIKEVEVVDSIDEVDEKETLNKEMLLRMILIIFYTLVIAFLIMGFIGSLTNSITVNSDVKESYLVSEKIVEPRNAIDIRSASKILENINGDYFVYISYTNKNYDNVQTLERGLANLIDKYDLKNKFYYVNIDPVMNYDNSMDLINKYMGYTDVLISKVPTIVYVNKDNIVRRENIITRLDDNLITVGDFQSLLDNNQFVAKK